MEDDQHILINYINLITIALKAKFQTEGLNICNSMINTFNSGRFFEQLSFDDTFETDFLNYSDTILIQ